MKPPAGKVARPPGRRRVQVQTGQDRVGSGYFLPVQVEDGLGRLIWRGLPARRFVEIDRLIRGHAAEPEPLIIDGEVPQHPQARPPRRQYRAPEGLLRRPVLPSGWTCL